MTSVNEAVGTPLSDSFPPGLANISYDQEVTFRRYTRLILPIDGFVFWVAASIVQPGSALFNNTLFNTAKFNQSAPAILNATTLTAPASVHYSTIASQDEASSASTNSVIVTMQQEVAELNSVDPNQMWVAELDGIQFAFRERFRFYAPAGVYHYRGNALFSTNQTQLIDSANEIDLTQGIVSNSLPIWLGLNALAPMYPSFAIPSNLPPPYIGVHIDPRSTEALQATPYIMPNSTSWQLVKDTVKFSLYGFNNNQAIDFQNYILDNSLADDPTYGIMSMPVVQDERMPQVEFQILTQRKTFALDVNYYQARTQDIARQLITSALITVTVQE